MHDGRVRSRARLLLAAAAATAIPFFPGVSQAHVFSAPSTVTIDQRGNRFFGSVSSSRGRCIQRRLVRLVKIRPDGRRVIVGRDRTGRHGNWVIRTRRRGRFQAVVTRKVGGGYGHSHRCRRDRSPVIRRGRR